MSARIEVSVNGKRICIAGFDSIGSLTALVEMARRQDDEPVRQTMTIGGFGQYQVNQRKPQFANWSVPEIGVDDEITIRILPPGEFDPPNPSNVRPLTSVEIDDQVFGSLKYQIDAWNGEVEFDHPPMKKAFVHLVGSEEEASPTHKELFLELKRRHDQLWPSIAEALVKCHETITTTEELETQLQPLVGINMYDESSRIELVYNCENDPEMRGYFVTLRDWEVVEIVAAS